MRSSGVSARTSSPARLASDSEVSHQGRDPQRPAAPAGTALTNTAEMAATAAMEPRRSVMARGYPPATVTVAAVLPRSDRPVRSSLAPRRTA